MITSTNNLAAIYGHMDDATKCSVYEAADPETQYDLLCSCRGKGLPDAIIESAIKSHTFRNGLGPAAMATFYGREMPKRLFDSVMEEGPADLRVAALCVAFGMPYVAIDHEASSGWADPGDCMIGTEMGASVPCSPDEDLECSPCTGLDDEELLAILDEALDDESGCMPLVAAYLCCGQKDVPEATIGKAMAHGFPSVKAIVRFALTGKTAEFYGTI